ncbi:MAG TPA: DUF4184 family protein [Acidimicrobiales bacterium]|jgi:hypothetical protein|nr:DUF4184 family protein [Acidimicrobiales bacterium]
MPFTFFAHQVPVLPLKLARPRWFDGTALCIGSMAPDLGYPIEPWVSHNTHTALGIVTWGAGFTFVACFAIRRWVASTTFAQLPDAGRFRLHSLRALATRRPAAWITVMSAIVGAASHVVVDAFTHEHRFAARWFGFDHVAFTTSRGPVTIARLLQNGGHTIGTLVGLGLLAHIGRTRRLEQWYGTATVRDCRSFTLTQAQRVRFWSIVAFAVVAGLVWSLMRSALGVFELIDATALGVVIASALPACRPKPGYGADAPRIELAVTGGRHVGAADRHGS